MPLNLQGPVNFFSSTYLLNQRVKEHGLPRWAWWAIGITSSVCIGAAVGTYLVTRSWVAPAIFLWIGWLVAVATATFAEMARQWQGRRPH
jgi:hypothetical protein